MNRLLILKPNNPSEVNGTLPDHIVTCTGFLSTPTILVGADDSGAENSLKYRSINNYKATVHNDDGNSQQA